MDWERSIYGGFRDDYNLEGIGISTLTADQMRVAVPWNDERPANKYARTCDIV